VLLSFEIVIGPVQALSVPADLAGAGAHHRGGGQIVTAYCIHNKS